MKKFIIFMLAIVLTIGVEARPKSNLHFAPKAKHGKHKTWKQKPVKKWKLKDCAIYWK